ncbi:hypothetical protein LAZ67_12000433, partial [Cordylochernes scorpioides]
MAASNMRNRRHVQLLLTWSTNAAHPVSLEPLQGTISRAEPRIFSKLVTAPPPPFSSGFGAGKGGFLLSNKNAELNLHTFKPDTYGGKKICLSRVNISLSKYYRNSLLICVVLMLLILAGIEQNPGPRMSKQTTLETSLDRDKEIKDLINALTKRLNNWGERLESRLSAIDDRVENINQRLHQLEESSAVTKAALSQNTKKIKDLEDQLEYLDAKSRERNLIFYGIEQDTNEDCRERIRRVIEENMRTTEKINITRCHRVSRKPGAPILVEVPEQKDRTTLFEAAFNLRGTKISLSKDYSMKMREQRRVLNVKRRELVEKGTLAKLRDNKLIINGIAYKVCDGQIVDANGHSLHIDYHMSEGNEVLIAGDINIRIGNAGGFHNPLKLNSPLNKYRKSKDLISSKLSEKLISFTDSNSITIANGRTRGDTHGSFTFISERGSSVLDYFMYTHGLTQIISDMWIEELSYSDHLPIVLQINTGYEAIKSSYKNEILIRKFIWTKENVEMLKHNLSDIEVGNETDINTETANFTKQIYTAMESANIIKFAKRRHQLSKPWYDKDCYIMKKTTKVSLQRCRNSNNIHDRQKYIEARREYFKLLQRKRDEFNKDKNERIKNAKDPKSFWNAIASFRKKPIIQGEIDIKEWFLFYKNLLNKENKEATFTVNQMIGWKDPDLDAEITLEEIHDVVKKLANGKAVGLDGIPNELLKNLPIPTLNKLKNLFNKIMSTEKYPQLWTNSIVHPIYKSGDKNNPTNYRGIALCSNISKLFTTILSNRLNNWIEKRVIILENQAGFRKNRSCTDHIILLNSLIQLSLRRKRGKLYVFFVDLTKAFDTVPHDLLWQKLHKMGISNKFVMLIKNFYQEAKITIRWKGQYSNNVKINSGVLQGESLSPLLFILYMADLIELYNNSALTGFHLPDFGVLHLLMYADDIAIIGESKINLQIKINLLKSYLDKNKLVLNENKSKIIVFRNGGRPARHENWYWGDTPLTVASNITYLGYPFTSTINSKKIKAIPTKVNESEISLNQVINTLLESELDDTQYDDYSKAKEDIFNMLVSIEEALSLIETKENIHSDKQLPESNVNLPKINLPIFNGDSANWLSFREIFNSTINSNQTLTEIQKFQYLNASVKGPAEKLIRGFPISDKNYQQAWDTLCNRFNNRRELAFSQINKIFSIRPLKSISAGSLYEILDVCNEGIRNLSVLGLEKNTLTDLILINFFEKRIGEALRKEWELTLQNEEYPTFENFVNFLEKHARSLQGMRIPLFQEQKTSSKNMTAHGLYVNKGQNCILCHRFAARRPNCKQHVRSLPPEFLVEKYEEFKKLSYNYKMYPSCHLTLTQKYSSAYLIRVIAILLIIGGVELNPGPPTKKQTTLSTVRTPETKEVMEDDLKSIVIQIHTELRTLGARLESRLHNIEQKFDEWDQRLTVIETSQKTCLELATKNDLRIKTLEDHGDMLDRKTRENNLIFYGIKGPEAENSDETLCKLVTAINEKMQIQIESEIMRCHRLSKKANAPILVEIPKQTTRIALLRNSYKLRGDTIFVNKDYTLKTREQRRLLITKKKELSEKGIHSKLRDNKLFANGQKYEVVDGRVVVSERKARDLIMSPLAEGLLEFLEDNSLTIINGRSIGDREGDFTYVSERGSSTIDYCIVSQGILEKISDFRIETQMYSDHLPLILKLTVQNTYENKSKGEEYGVTRYRWTAGGIKTFKQELKELQVVKISNLDSSVNTFTQRITEAMSTSGIMYSTKGATGKSKPWFDKNCYDMKKLTKESLKEFRRTNRKEDLESYALHRKKYLGLLDDKRRKYIQEKQEILRNIKDSKSFWKTIALFKGATKIQGEITVQEWHEFYCELMSIEEKRRSIHKLNDCQRFINLPLPKKWEFVKKHKLCQNCLRANHEISKCLITSRCKNCKQNHHTLLHEYNSEPSIPQPTTSQEMLISTNTICNVMPLETETNILLSTALIKVKAKDGSFVLCRALVDNGSQISLISEQCCHKLGLEKRKNSYTLKGVGDIVVNRTTSQVEIEFTPHHNDQLFSARAFVVGRVTADLPNFQIQSADFPHLENLLLADPEFYVTKPIDLILGADTFVEIILGHKTDLKHHPIALNTKLGWLVSGRIHSTIKSNTSVINHCTTELDSSIRKFWELEDVPISKAQLGTKNACEILSKSNLKRDIEGRYSVNLPFKSTPNLGDSRSQALEKGLQENPSKSEDNSSKSEENLSRSEDNSSKSEENLSRSEDNPSKSEEIPSKSKKSRISKLTPQITSKQNQLLPSESSQPSTPEQPLASQSSEPLSSKKETSIIPKIKPPPYYRRKRQLPAEKTSWDEPIESDIKSNWNKFQTQLSCLKEIKIPRYLNSSSSEIEELQLHGFCDASLNAYSAVFYLKTRFKNKKIKINLITSKTKVAPLKTITIPRLELSAALLLAQLNQVILESFPFQPDKTFLWTDSQICIDWIRSDASRWKAFVSNRVSSIQNLTQITDWFHVSSQDNPADCASRGIMPQDLVNHRIWWRGPIWLQENNVRYIPSSPTQVNLNIIQEEVGEGQVLDQTTLIQNSETMLNLEFIVRYSTMTKLIRITAWCWRFYYNCLLFDPTSQKGPLTTRELTKAIQVLVKSIQQVEFCTEIKLLKSNKQLPLSNKLTSLNPFLDTQGLLRVGGRLKYSYLNENQKFPLLQPKSPRQESLIKNLLTENADIPEAIDENQEDSSILETTFVIEDEESNKDIGTPKIEISEVSVIDNSEGKYSKEPVVSAEALDKKELCHDDSAHLNVVEADLNRPKEATSGIINVFTEANESASKEKVVPVEIVDTSTKDYLQSGEKAKLSRWKPIDSLCLEDVKESEDDDENYSSSAYIEWPEILKKEVLRPEALEKAVNLEDFEKAAESRQLSKEHLEESTEQGSCIKAESKPWEDPIESDLAAAEVRTLGKPQEYNRKAETMEPNGDSLKDLRNMQQQQQQTYRVHSNGRTRGDTHGSFTFISERGSSVLDYFMYTHGLTQIISDMWIEELSYSDHLPIVLQINTGYEAIKSSYKNEILTRKFIWTKENVEMLKHNLSDIEVGNETDINTETANFTKQIYTAMESANIIKFAKRRHQLSKPWYDKDCYIMKKTTKVSLQRCRNSNNIHDRQKYIEARREYFKLLQRKRDEFNKDKNERIKNAKDPKSFWNAIASFRKKPIIQGEIDIKEWFLFYKNLLNKENKEATFTVNQMIGWKDPDLDAEITLEEIHDVVKKLANGKAVGLDGILSENGNTDTETSHTIYLFGFDVITLSSSSFLSQSHDNHEIQQKPNCPPVKSELDFVVVDNCCVNTYGFCGNDD